jgi:hypothetical protein
MKIPVITVSLLILVLMISYLVLAPSGEVENQAGKSLKQFNQNEGKSGFTNNGLDQDENFLITDLNNESRRINMQEAYAKLELSRKHLKSRANLLKSKMWGMELPKKQAAFVSNNMRQAYAYLKNPAMLGAYFEEEEIQIELKQLTAMHEDLNEIEKILTTPINKEN